jgi:AraC family transcriptional regulator of adaptative response / DNA-3-methyladenine glycosylase II
MPGAWDPFELAVRAILGQQVSVASATTSAGRLAEQYGEPLPAPVGSVVRLFPKAAVLAAADPAAMRLPRARAQAIVALARAVDSGELALEPRWNLEETVARLTAQQGIGEWTAQYIAMRALGEPDAFPAADLGLLAAARAWMPDVTPARLLARAEAWRPWRAYAAMHLWRSLGPARPARPSRARVARG